jgi:hypothetical protein
LALRGCGFFGFLGIGGEDLPPRPPLPHLLHFRVPDFLAVLPSSNELVAIERGRAGGHIDDDSLVRSPLGGTAPAPPRCVSSSSSSSSAFGSIDQLPWRPSGGCCGASENQPKVYSKSKKKRRDLQNHPKPIKKRYQIDGKTSLERLRRRNAPNG